AEGLEKAKAAAIAKGVAIMVKEPFAARFDQKHRIVPGPRAERELLTTMLEMRLGGSSFGEILEVFEQATGRQSSRHTMQHILANEVYIGVLQHGRHRNEQA